MRILMSAAIAWVGAGAVLAPSAYAKQTPWQCIGPEYVCGTPATSANPYKAHSHKAKSTYKSTQNYRTKRTTYGYSFEPSRTQSSFSGGRSYSGVASYYWQPQAVASGGRFNPNALTAAHKTLPFGTKVRVTNLNNGRSVVVTINDRGPFVKGRVIDLSRRAAGVIGMRGAGLARVNVAVL